MLHIPEGKIWDLDRELMLAVNGSWGTGGDIFWWLMSQPWFWIPLFLTAMWLLYRQFGWKKMLVAFGLVVLGLALADQVANFFKTFTPKFRPLHTTLLWDGVPYNQLIHTVDVDGHRYGNYGTVSGHVATAMAIAMTSAGILRRRWFSIAMGAYVALTFFSRMYLGVHFPLDVIFGLTAGILIGLLMLWLWRLINRKWEPERRQ